MQRLKHKENDSLSFNSLFNSGSYYQSYMISFSLPPLKSLVASYLFYTDADNFLAVCKHTNGIILVKSLDMQKISLYKKKIKVGNIKKDHNIITHTHTHTNTNTHTQTHTHTYTHTHTQNKKKYLSK